jgi:L-rhamnonate dehydratase
MPHIKWTTGEHEYSRYGFRKLIEDRSIDILQVRFPGLNCNCGR